MACYSLVEGLRLLEIDDVKADALSANVFNCEIEPLQVPSGVCIDSQVQIVLSLPHPHHGIKVSTLKVTVKEQFRTRRESGVHAFEDACIFRLEIGMKLAKIGGHVGVVRSESTFVLESVAARHLLMKTKTADESASQIDHTLAISTAERS